MFQFLLLQKLLILMGRSVFITDIVAATAGYLYIALTAFAAMIAATTIVVCYPAIEVTIIIIRVFASCVSFYSSVGCIP